MNVWLGSSIVTPLSSQWRFVRSRSSRSARASCQRSLTPWVSSPGACTRPTRWPMPASTPTTSVRYSSPWALSGRDAAQGRPEQVAAEGVDARGDLVDRPLVGRRVALLDDAHDLAVAAGDDAAVAGRVVDDARQQRRRAAVGDVGGDELVERLRQQQRACRRARRRRSSRRRGRRRGTPSCRWRRRRRCRAASACSTNTTFAHAGARSWTFFVTCSAPWPTTSAVRAGCSRSRAAMTCITIARPHIMCSGLGRVERIRVPSPAARTIAETLIGRTSDGVGVRRCSSLRGEESNPYSLNQNQASYRLNDPGTGSDLTVSRRSRHRPVACPALR